MNARRNVRAYERLPQHSDFSELSLFFKVQPRKLARDGAGT